MYWVNWYGTVEYSGLLPGWTTPHFMAGGKPLIWNIDKNVISGDMESEKIHSDIDS